ncbi:MAG: hypothetical protein WBB22_16385 [Anaerolineae bacterium]
MDRVEESDPILAAEPVVELEFVLEPATIALLGSGLAGLSGYVGFRSRFKRRN